MLLAAFGLVSSVGRQSDRSSERQPQSLVDLIEG